MTKNDVSVTDELKTTAFEFAKAQQLYELVKRAREAKDLDEFRLTLENMLDAAMTPKED